MKNSSTLFALALFLFTLAGCDNRVPSSDQVQAAATRTMTAEAQRQVGMPNITNFTERKFAKMILELCDTEGLRTFTYIVDMHGQTHFLCDSIGYGLPYSTQFTNPQRVTSERVYNGAKVSSWYKGLIPQPDPNGLFKPDGLSATWVLAATVDGVVPLYVEPQIIVSPFRLGEVAVVDQSEAEQAETK